MPPDNSEAISSKDRLLMVGLACGLTQVEAAASAHVSEATVQRRLRDPNFRRGIEEERDLLISRALGIASGALAEAFEVLAKIARDDDQPATPRVAAAKGLGEMVLRYRDSQELIRRIEQLEETFAGRTGDPVERPPVFERAS